MKKTIRQILIFSVLIFSITDKGFAQKLQLSQSQIDTNYINLNFLSSKAIEANWHDFYADKGWQKLQSELETKNFFRILNKEAKWGFSGTVGKGKKDSVLLCIYDFLNPKNPKQGCSMLWARVGSKTYKAYLIFPEGETKDVDKKFDEAAEWYFDELTHKVALAHSWGKKFKRCVKRGSEVPNIETELSNNRSVIKIGGGTVTIGCPGICLASALGCTTLAAGVAITISVAGIATAASGGITTQALIAAGGIGAAMLFTCVGVGCGVCVLVCAVAAI